MKKWQTCMIFKGGLIAPPLPFFTPLNLFYLRIFLNAVPDIPHVFKLSKDKKIKINK